MDYGAGDEKKLKEDIWHSFWFILSVSVFLYFVVYPGMEIIQRLLQTPVELLDMTRAYMSVVFAGILFVFMYNFFSYLLRAMGNSPQAVAGIGILFLWYGYFRGINKPHISLILTIISLGTRVALSYALAPNTELGVVVIWVSIPIGWVLADVCGYIFYGRRKV